MKKREKSKTLCCDDHYHKENNGSQHDVKNFVVEDFGKFGL